MKYNSLIPELSVTDIDKTKTFYVDVLGFRVAYERPENKFVFVAKEDNQVMLEQVNHNWNTGELEYPFGRGVNFEMNVSDVDSLYKTIIDKGVVPFKSMETVVYQCDGEEIKQKQFLVQDPDGYLLRFVS